MILRRPLAALAVPLLLALTPALAVAEPSDVDRATARALATEGFEASEQRDYARALDRYARADALIHAPTLLLGVARAQVGLGKLVAAQEAYNRILREGIAPRSPPAFAQAVEDARREVEALAVRIPSVVIHLKGAADARVTLDGAPVPSAALGIRRPTDPGKHLIHAEAAGFFATDATVTLAEGKSETVTLKLEPAPRAVAPPTPPPIAPPVDTLAPPPVAPPADAPEPAGASSGSAQRTGGFAAIGLGGVALVLGGVTGGLALAKHDALQMQCPGGECGPGQQSDLDTYHLLGTLSTVGVVAGGALAASGLILVVTAPRAQPGASQGFLAPVIGAGYLGARGAF